MSEMTPIDDQEILRILGSYLAQRYGPKGVDAQVDLMRIATKLQHYEDIVLRIKAARQTWMAMDARLQRDFPEFLILLDELVK